MEFLLKIMRDVDMMARLKANDPITYVKVVNRCMILGIITGSLGTLWLLTVAYLVFIL